MLRSNDGELDSACARTVEQGEMQPRGVCAHMRPEPWHCPTKAYGTLGGVDSFCANELFLNNDQTWFRE